MCIELVCVSNSCERQHGWRGWPFAEKRTVEVLRDSLWPLLPYVWIRPGHTSEVPLPSFFLRWDPSFTPVKFSVYRRSQIPRELCWKLNRKIARKIVETPDPCLTVYCTFYPLSLGFSEPIGSQLAHTYTGGYSDGVGPCYQKNSSDRRVVDPLMDSSRSLSGTFLPCPTGILESWRDDTPTWVRGTLGQEGSMSPGRTGTGTTFVDK